ncbi:alpha/beta fold hydrolase [Propionibacteriaceae bacterium Y2011]
MSATMVPLPDGTALGTWTTGTPSAERLPVLLMHGGPGVRDYLAPVAACLDDTWLVHRYDQRGVGVSRWRGAHTLDRAVADAISLLDHWGHQRVTLVGHSFGTNLSSYITLAHPERVGGLVHLSGPFLGPRWRDGQKRAEQARRSPAQQARLDELNAQDRRSDAEDIEHLTLSWFTDHADQSRAWQWAAESARAARPINFAMNQQLNSAERATPLEDRMDELRQVAPAGTTIIGGAGDSRPEAELHVVAEQLGVELVVIPDAGHDPWLEQPTEFRDLLRSAVAKQDLIAMSG